MSIHINKAIDVARKRGGAAGADEARQLWDLPKREMVEVMLHLAALCTDSYEDSLENGDAVERVLEEHRALRSNAII